VTDVRVIRLPWTTPPLSLNERTHWARKARTTREVRQITQWLAQSHRIPPRRRIAVRLLYTPRDLRRRDADNLTPVLKAVCDGLVDAGVVPDDTPDYMLKVMPEILPADHRDPRLEVWIDLDPPPVDQRSSDRPPETRAIPTDPGPSPPSLSHDLPHTAPERT
jgi:crossover junction endodeoxyribonuclease RusA